MSKFRGQDLGDSLSGRDSGPKGGDIPAVDIILVITVFV